MILGHCSFFTGFGYISLHSIFGFFMPWFFYKSGLFFSIGGCKKLLKKDANKLLRSFVIYSLIGWMVWGICGLVDGSLDIKSCIMLPLKSFLRNGCINGNGALWFLISLFIVRQLFNILISNKLSPSYLSLVCFGVAYVLYAIGWYNHSWWIGNIFSGLCFFSLGYWLNNKITPKVFIISALVFGGILVAYFLKWIEIPFLYMHANKMNSGNYILFYPFALAGIITINRLFEILTFKTKLKYRILGYIGRNSMFFYVAHWILLTIVRFVAKYYFHVESPQPLFFILMVSCIVLLPFVSYVLSIQSKKQSIIIRSWLL